jgi:mannitol/fructose-specific phosphotransferase system IIA component (Ntr-type)
MILVLVFLKLELLVKVASSILILLYILANLTLILFRESKIISYKPRFQAPLYPYLQVFGILAGFFLLIENGSIVLSATMFFLFLGYLWYRLYARKNAIQDSALIYVLERLVSKDKELASVSLLTELKDIVIQRDEIVEDQFHTMIERSETLDIKQPLGMEDFFLTASEVLGKGLNMNPAELYDKFMTRESRSSTVIAKGIAIPHISVEKEDVLEVLLVRAHSGIIFPVDKVIHILFVFVGSSGERILHLKILAAIAQITQDTNFYNKWMSARSEEELRYAVLLAERKRR